MSQKTLILPAVLTVKQLAEILDQPVTMVIGKLMGYGVLASINEDIDFETASVIADEFGVTVEKEVKVNNAAQIKEQANATGTELRPPIVTIMGHVDHGKTTLLDTIRHTRVAAGEAGGITQHISSYQVVVKPKDGGEGRLITFLDTPGHSAFEAMRRHGAQITDLVVLVVAADDGIKPQTIEAINHARQMNVPIIVALNKIDKPDADLERVKGQLAEYDLTPEEWGGKTVVVNISAKNDVGIENLLEMLLLATDIRELKANPNTPGIGVVVESQVRPGVGPVATVLVQNGAVKTGDYIAIGAVSGRIRTLIDHRGKRIDEAGPSTPVAISGLSGLPNFGEQFAIFSNEKDARESAKQFLRGTSAKRAGGAGSGLQVTAAKEGDRSIMNVVVKADTIGSLEAIRTNLAALRNDYVEVRIVADGVGDISEGDITMASTAKATVLGFNAKMPTNIRQISEREKVAVSMYTVVYELFDDIRDALAELMPMQDVEIIIGRMLVLARFRDNRKNAVIGGRVEEGIMEPKRAFRIMRGEKEVGKGNILELRRGKENARNVQTGSECGMEVSLNGEVTVNDMLILFRTEQQRLSLGL